MGAHVGVAVACLKPRQATCDWRYITIKPIYVNTLAFRRGRRHGPRTIQPVPQDHVVSVVTEANASLCDGENPLFQRKASSASYDQICHVELVKDIMN
ncbi:hypothetical protein ASF70_22735 [Rhizobium sp. Leaf321]|nr:hypothetical protein ASF70_22735 [Rhizobium sp. Leaf321]